MKTYEKIAIAFWTIVCLSVAHYCYHLDEKIDVYINDPKVGDIYYVNLALMDEVHIDSKVDWFKTRAYSIMKLVKIDRDSLHFMRHDTYTSKSGGELIFVRDGPDRFLKEPLILSVTRVHELYKIGAINDIKRK